MFLQIAILREALVTYVATVRLFTIVPPETNLQDIKLISHAIKSKNLERDLRIKKDLITKRAVDLDCSVIDLEVLDFENLSVHLQFFSKIEFLYNK